MTDDDKRMAARFVRALTGDAATPCTWQTFDDGPLKRPALARILHGPLAVVGTGLAAANAAGAGVFVTVNRTDLRGRQRRNVQSVRAVFVDCDGFEPSAWHLPPSLVVRSGRGMHAYWCVGDAKLDEFEAAQRRLAMGYTSDPKVCDLPRVMRVPGFAHLKAEPRPVTLLAAAGTVYPLAAALAGLPDLPRPKPRPAPRVGRVDWRSFDVVELFRDAGLYRRALAGDKHAVICPWEGEHTDPDYTSETATGTVVWRGPPQTFLCSHSHCDGRKLHDALLKLGAVSPRDAERAVRHAEFRSTVQRDAERARAALAAPI